MFVVWIRHYGAADRLYRDSKGFGQTNPHKAKRYTLKGARCQFTRIQNGSALGPNIDHPKEFGFDRLED